MAQTPRVYTALFISAHLAVLRWNPSKTGGILQKRSPRLIGWLEVREMLNHLIESRYSCL